MEPSNQPSFDAPIPGMSLTAEIGSRPWQQSSQFTDVDSAIEYYMARMTNEEFMVQLVDVLEMGIPITAIVNTMTTAGVMEGKHTIDVSVLIMPILVEMMMMIGDSAGIEYDSGLEDPDKNKTRKTLLAKYAREFSKELNKVDLDEAREEMPEEEEVDMEPQPSGLMARRK
jgi:hypothetical protein